MYPCPRPAAHHPLRLRRIGALSLVAIADDGNPSHAGCIIRVGKDGSIPQDNIGRNFGAPACWVCRRTGFLVHLSNRRPITHLLHPVSKPTSPFLSSSSSPCPLPSPSPFLLFLFSSPPRRASTRAYTQTRWSMLLHHLFPAHTRPLGYPIGHGCS